MGMLAMVKGMAVTAKNMVGLTKVMEISATEDIVKDMETEVMVVVDTVI